MTMRLHSSLLAPFAHFAPRRVARPGVRAAAVRQLLFGFLALVLVWLATAPTPLRARDANRWPWAPRPSAALPAASPGMGALGPLLDAASELDDAAKLHAVNRFFNSRIRFRDDSEAWGQADYWASPLELLAKGEGDCEDFAIAKYFSLRALGMPASQLRLVYVRARIDGPPPRQQAHMVLAHTTTPGAEPSILDNLVPDVLPATRRSDLSPVFSFNADGLWQGLGAQPAGDPMLRLSRWRETVAKARAEGFP